jgi:hypothetical protein
MALNGQSTSNFELYKPSLTDSPPDITSTNENWDIIDAELKRLSDVGLPANVNGKLPLAIASSEVKYIYLATNGNDDNDGTSTKPLKTIATAISRFGGTARLILRFNAGTYTETNAIEVAGCTGVEFVPVEGASVTINVHYYQHGGYFSANNISFTSPSSTTHNTLTFYGVTVFIENCTFAVKNAALAFRNGSQGVILSSEFNNCTNVIYAMGGSVVNAQTITGTGNTYAYYSAGAIIIVGTSTITATTLATKAAGGVIFRGGNLIGTTANTFVNAT